MFKEISDRDYITNVAENGWIQLDMRYFANNHQILSKARRALSVCRAAHETVRRRYRDLNSKGRILSQCPKKGVAVKENTTSWYSSWLDELLDTYLDHYGDVVDADAPLGDSTADVDHYVTGKHERFQAPKMGMFAPYARGSLTNSVSEYIELANEANSHHLDLDLTDDILAAFHALSNEDLSGIPDGSLSAVSARDAIYESNVQGLATGLVQKARDEVLSPVEARQLSLWYGWNFDSRRTVAENLIDFYDGKVIDFAIHRNIVTNLKRVQVGGISIDMDDLPERITNNLYKDAKYRTINANDPMCQIAEASVAIPFREAIKAKCDPTWYNTLLDPDNRWDCIKRSHLKAHANGVTQFPFDFSKHDARLHAEWMYNLMHHVVKPKYRVEDQYLIEITAVCLVFKILLAPRQNGYEFVGVVGALGSGDPWTNIIGTLGTRAVGHLLAQRRPDVFYVRKGVGYNNGDDASYGIYKSAIRMFGIDGVIKIANEIVNSVFYVFNDSKLISIRLPDDSFVDHWEQYAIWNDPSSETVRRHGSTLRYFGKVYSDEDLGRQDALEGLIDQMSSINNTIGYVGDQTFSVTTFGLDVMSSFIKRDDVLTSYINQYGEAFFDHLVDDAVDKRAKAILEDAEKRKVSITKEDAKRKAEEKILRHLRAAGFDKSGLKRVIHDRDFSFLSVTKLVGLGAAELSSIAATGKGLLLHYQVENGRIHWLSNYAV